METTKTLNTPTFGSLDNIKEDEENRQSCGLKDYELNINSSIDTVFEKDQEMPILTMKGCKFSWGTEESLLSIDDLSFPCGNLLIAMINKSFEFLQMLTSLIFRSVNFNRW